MADLTEYSEQREELKRDCLEFLEQDFGAQTGDAKYVRKIQDLIKQWGTTKSLRLEVDLQDLQDFNEELHRRTLDRPGLSLLALEDAADDLLRGQQPPKELLESGSKVQVGLTGEFGHNKVSPRQLTSEFLSKLVCVQGIVTRCTLVRPKVQRSEHWAPECGAWVAKTYRDFTSHEGEPTSTNWPIRDEHEHRLVTQYGLSKFVDHQTVTIQELPETAPPGQLPRSVEVILEGDLRDAAKPGDRVAVVGIYKPLAPRAAGSVSGVFNAKLVANNVWRLDAAALSPSFSEQDYDNITELAEERDLMDQLAHSLAPSIYGYATIKKALLLLLAGGRERVLPNGGRLRGDINALLVGDPGVAKSQLLRAVMALAPLAVSTTGRGSSGVGLTAAVTTDQETGERRLEAGAMVLADRGVVCIDEFDKMSDADRVAIHEVMEQQTVTIAKAGILTQLNARCSVVAAANPIYGHYDRSISITRNIGLPDSLLSRFDLLFVVLDNNDAARDREIAEHVLGQHRYRAAGDDGRNAGDDRYIESLEDDESAATGTTQMRCKYDARLFGPRHHGQKEPLTIGFLRKYLAFAKQRFAAPELTPEAADLVAEYYADLRSSAEVKALPVTVRTLETVIRLSCAHAKLRLSALVERRDVEEATRIVDLILKSDPSAVHEAPAAGRRPHGERDAAEAGTEPMEAEGAAPMEADEPISDDEAPAPAGTSGAPASQGQGATLEAAVRKAVEELTQGKVEGAQSVTGVRAVLAARGVAVSSDQVLEVLRELEAADKLMMEGEDFYVTH